MLDDYKKSSDAAKSFIQLENPEVEGYKDGKYRDEEHQTKAFEAAVYLKNNFNRTLLVADFMIAVMEADKIEDPSPLMEFWEERVEEAE